MRSASHSTQVIDVWLLVTAPGKEPISLHAESEVDGGASGAFDRLVPPLVAEARERLVGK